jgi:TetR/AcrR family transcriptional repressor of nem operon
MDGTAQRWADLLQGEGAQPLETLLRHYLSEQHRDQMGSGCMFAALAGDAARQEDGVRKAYSDGLSRLLDMLGGCIRGRSRQARRRQAIATMAEMVGAVILARAVDDPDLSKEILTATAQDLRAGNRAAPAD